MSSRISRVQVQPVPVSQLVQRRRVSGFEPNELVREAEKQVWDSESVV